MDVEIGPCPIGCKSEEVVERNGKQVLIRCPWYTLVRGMDPNTGKELDEWRCAIAWIPTLLVNSANESRKNVAAIESFRNEMVRESEKTREIMGTSKVKLIN